MSALLTLDSLSGRMEGIRGHFTEGGRWGDLALVTLALAGCMLVLALIYHVQQVAGRRPQDHPGRLFRSLMGGLGLTTHQRRKLQRVAADLGLEHPTVLLLSPHIFRKQAQAWAERRAEEPDGEIEAIERRIFGTAPAAHEQER